jgi:hypothetical protein
MEVAHAACLLSLPTELLHHLLMRAATGKDSLLLARCCWTLHRLISSDRVLWHDKLRSDWGFTEAGLALWHSTGHTLMQAYDYFHCKHEPLECCLLREPHPAISPGWEGCVDLKVCVEVVNPWPVKVWTLFRICGPDECVAAGGVDGRWQLPLCRDSADRLICVGYAGAGGRDAVLVSIAAAAEPRACTPLDYRSMAVAAIGWMPSGEQLSHAVPAVQAMLLPPAGAGQSPPLAVLGEHAFRVDAEMWRAIRASGGQPSLHVMQCVELRAYGLDLPLEDASPYELCCHEGVQVPTTRASERHNRALSGRLFEWRASAHRETIEADQTARHVVLQPVASDLAHCVCSLPGGTAVVQGGWELEAAPPPSGHDLPPLTFRVLCHSRAAIATDF